jgi:hypothetical protein
VAQTYSIENFNHYSCACVVHRHSVYLAVGGVRVQEKMLPSCGDRPRKGIVCCRGALSRIVPSAPYVSVQKQPLNPEHQPYRESTQHPETMWVPCTPRSPPWLPHLMHGSGCARYQSWRLRCVFVAGKPLMLRAMRAMPGPTQCSCACLVC